MSTNRTRVRDGKDATEGSGVFVAKSTRPYRHSGRRPSVDEAKNTEAKRSPGQPGPSNIYLLLTQCFDSSFKLYGLFVSYVLRRDTPIKKSRFFK